MEFWILGAGAVVLQPTATPGGLLSFVLGSDGSGACSLYVPAGGSRRPTSAETVAERAHYVKMQGREVFRFATRVVPESVLQALEAARKARDPLLEVRALTALGFQEGPRRLTLSA